MSSPIDFLGQPINPGDYVAFTARYSSSMWLQIGKVISTTPKTATVRSCRKRWNSGVEVASKNGTLTALERVIVLSSVPEYISKALTEAQNE